MNEAEIFSQHSNQTKSLNLDNKSIKKEFDILSRPGLGMNKIIDEEKQIKINEELKNKIDNKKINIAKKDEQHKDNKSYKSHHHHHHHHHRHHNSSNKSKSEEKRRCRSRSKSN